jgi:prepilin-type N-terminal cleavage/methylation domain-containing protein
MNRKGFTLIELMIVVVIIGLLAAIAIPNFTRMTNRAREARVKVNMHSLQLAAEDFGLISGGRYPDDASDTADNGQTLVQLIPGGAFPENPFTNSPTIVGFDAPPTAGNPGEISFNPAAPDSYRIRGNGLDGQLMNLELKMGQ